MQECNVSFVEVFGPSFNSWEDVDVCREEFEASFCIEFYKRDSYVRGKKSYVCFACKKKPCGAVLKLEQLHMDDAKVTVKEENPVHNHSVPYCREHVDDVSAQLKASMSKVSDLQKLQAEMASFQRTTFNMLNELKNGSQQEMPAIEEKRKPLSAFLTIFDESEREGCNETAFEVDMETADTQSSTVKKSTAWATRTSLSKAIEEPSIFTILRGKPEQVLGIVPP
ncbi:hypothetical protein AC1031_006016 [Aphanomyces cochlioides]|nr:hypothetical protein AC1031_006016 [Aphanomyces cochlioides]